MWCFEFEGHKSQPKPERSITYKLIHYFLCYGRKTSSAYYQFVSPSKPAASPIVKLSPERKSMVSAPNIAGAAHGSLNDFSLLSESEECMNAEQIDQM